MAQTLLRVNNVAKNFGWHDIFHHITFTLNTGEKTALVGPNGIGKSTLARIITGFDEPTAGSVNYLSDQTTYDYLPQNPEFPPTFTATQVLTDEMSRLGAAARVDVVEALGRFGFTNTEASLASEQLSGGQKTRLALARMWLSQPDLLVLDEPTNHLDLEGMEWLERFICDYCYTVLVISHDRYFLDEVAGRFLEMSEDGIVEYKGNYTSYRQCKEEAFAQQTHLYEHEQKEIRRIEEAIDRQMRWFRLAHEHAGEDSDIRIGVKPFYRAKAKKAAVRAKSNIKRLERMKEQSVDKPKPENAISLYLSQYERSGARIFLADNLGKSYGRVLFQHAHFAVLRGDKVGIIGPNGVGKTTLFRLLLGWEQPTWGSVWRTPSLQVGYLEQELESLCLQDTLLNCVLGLFPGPSAIVCQRVKQMLASFLFNQDDWNKKLDVLSYGERKRVALIRLLFGRYNVLLLDEPTNHLDLQAREKLEEAMRAYDGTMLVVSHDRYLIQNVCNKILCIRNGQIEVYPGTYDEYMRKHETCADATVATDGRGDGRGDGPALSVCDPSNQRLLLELRLAQLSAQLGKVVSEPDKAAQIEAEFFTVSRSLRLLKGDRNPEFPNR